MVSLVTSMTPPLNYIFVILRQCRCYSKTKTTKQSKTRRKMLSMAKLNDSRWFFITRLRYYKCVHAQGVIMLISISITIILLFNFEKNYSYVFMFLQNFKISFPSVLTVYFVLFFRENGEKTLTINLNKFCLHAVAGFARVSVRRGPDSCGWRMRMGKCGEKNADGKNADGKKINK